MSFRTVLIASAAVAASILTAPVVAATQSLSFTAFHPANQGLMAVVTDNAGNSLYRAFNQPLPSLFDAFLADNTTLTGRVGHDSALSPVEIGDGFARYSGQFAIDLLRNGQLVQASSNNLEVVLTDGAPEVGGDTLSALSPGYSPVPALDFAFDAPTDVRIDLAPVLEWYENAPQLESLTVTLHYSALQFWNFGVLLRDESGAAFDGLNWPTAIDSSAFIGTSLVGLTWGATAQISLDEADFASHADYLLAADWVAANATAGRVEYSMLGFIDNVSVTPVPEPQQALLWLTGLGLLVARRRR